MGSSIGGSGTVRSRGGVRATEGPLIEVQLSIMCNQTPHGHSATMASFQATLQRYIAGDKINHHVLCSCPIMMYDTPA